MAKISAPKSPEYDAVSAQIKRRASIAALRAKPTLSQVEKDNLLSLLMDDYLARNP